MDYTSLMKRIKRELGIMSWHLPMDDEEILDIIDEEVIIPFSTYYPMEHRVNINLSDDYYDDKLGEYSIPLDMYIPRGSKVISVHKINQTDGSIYNGIGSRGHIGLRKHSGSMLDSIYDSTINNMMDTLEQPSPTIDFVAPNTLKFYNTSGLYTSSVEVVFFITYPSLEYIPNSVNVFFNKLAVKTVQKYLYAILKYRDQIDTAYGPINLRIDDWVDAGREVDELLNLMADEQVLFSQYDKIWFTK